MIVAAPASSPRTFMPLFKIIQRGDMSPKQMRGAWAGELGQTQFMASSYLAFSPLIFDGNGRRDLVRSRADVPRLNRKLSCAAMLETWRKLGSWHPQSQCPAQMEQKPASTAKPSPRWQTRSSKEL